MTAIRPPRRLSPWFVALACLGFSACDPETNAPAMDPSLGQSRVDAGPMDPAPISPGADADVVPEDDPSLSINSVIPSRIAITGGTQILLVGQLFEEGVRVVLGDQACADIIIESDSHLRCTTPQAGSPGPVDLHVFAPDGDDNATLTEGVIYFVPTTVTAIDPIRGPAPGGYPVTIRGTGFAAGTTVRFGDRPASVSEIDEDGETMQVVVPSHAPGQANVVVTSLNGQTEAPVPFTWYEQLLINGLEPFVGRLAGEEEVRITGSGLAEDSVVRFGGEAAEILSSEFNATVLRVRTPAAMEPGSVELEIENINGRLTQAGNRRPWR